MNLFIVMCVLCCLVGTTAYLDVMFIDRTGIHEAGIDGSHLQTIVTWSSQGLQPCEGRGFIVDTSLGAIVFFCENDFTMYICMYKLPTPTITAVMRPQTYSVFGIDGDNKGNAYYSQFESAGWRIYHLDIATAAVSQDGFSFRSNYDVGGGLTLINGIHYCTATDKDGFGMVVTNAGPSQAAVYLQKLISWWGDVDLFIGFPVHWLDDLYVIQVDKMFHRSTLVKVDITDAVDPQAMGVTLPEYSVDTSFGSSTLNLQPSLGLIGVDTILFTDGPDIVSSKLDGSDRTVVHTSGAKIGALALIEIVPTSVPDTPVPDTPSPPTAIPTPAPDTLVPTPAPDTMVPTDSPTAAPGGGSVTESPTLSPGSTPLPPGQTFSPQVVVNTTSIPTSGNTTASPGNTSASNSSAPTVQATSTAVPTAVPEDDDEIFPFGSGSPIPFVIAICGVLCLCSGIIAVRVAQRNKRQMERKMEKECAALRVNSELNTTLLHEEPTPLPKGRGRSQVCDDNFYFISN